MKLYSASWCPHCQPVKLFIEQKKLGVLIVDVDTVNPGKLLEKGVTQIPCLEKDDGSLMYESKDILKFLGSK